MEFFPLSKINMKTCSESCKNAKNFFCALWPPPPSSLDWDLWLSIHQEKRLSLQWIPWEEVDTTRWTMDPTQRTSMGGSWHHQVNNGSNTHTKSERDLRSKRFFMLHAYHNMNQSQSSILWNACYIKNHSLRRSLFDLWWLEQGLKIDIWS